ncbi:Cytochrome c oxidase subunit 6B [Myotisia sp. PD_48]|nr:Cytochrome c oxidase subunit 6B [Myotisia sp. PD_48]
MPYEIPDADPEEPVETKPFMFVTGMYYMCLEINLTSEMSKKANTIDSWYVFSTFKLQLICDYDSNDRNNLSRAPTNARCLGYDARFPNMNQTKHCWQNYVDYYKCVNAKGEDFRPCKQFFLAFRSLCPKSWTDRWDDQREAGTFPARLDQ